MEEMDLSKLGFFLEDEIFLIPEDAQEILLADKFKDVEEGQPDAATPANPPIEEQDQAAAASSEPVVYEGGFEKGVLIIYQGERIADDIRSFLMKIMGAVNHSLKDIALVSSIHLSGLPSQALNQLNPHKTLVFGRISHPIIQLKEQDYEVTSDQDTEYLFADDLGVIFEDENLKRKLWKSLQVFFHIKK